MLQPDQAGDERSRGAGRLRLLRPLAVVVWVLLLLSFWLLLSHQSGEPLRLLREVARSFALSRWAPAMLLALYAARPLLLLPITVLNLACGFALGASAGIPLALLGTLVSASTGYAIGMSLGTEELATRSQVRWRFVRLLRSRSFEAVAAGGLMYLHADLVNLPAGILRLHFPTFLLGIAVGNSLTLTMAVLAGAAIEVGGLGADVSVDLAYIVGAAALFLASLLLARSLRARIGPADGDVRSEGNAE
ncbi:MAG TPA: VTT domain-containing protein [Trueperaceae bacterium]